MCNLTFAVTPPARRISALKVSQASRHAPAGAEAGNARFVSI